METRANHVLIGFFTLAVLVGAFGFVWWFGGSSSSDRTSYRVVFEGSVAGLTRGSAVMFNGLTVGEVTDIRFSPSEPGKIYTKIAVDPGVPVRTDTKARLESQGLTGVSSVMLEGGRNDAPVLAAATAGDLPTIVAEPGGYASVIEGARRIMERADGILNQVQKVVETNTDPINQSIANVQKFTDALAKNSDGIDDFLAATGEMAKAVSAVAGPLQELTLDARAIVKAVDPQKVANIVGGAEKFAIELGAVGPKLGVVLDQAGDVTTNLISASDKLNTTLTGVQSVVAAVDPEKIRKVVDNATLFSETLARNGPSVDEIVADARELSDRLNKASVRVDGILQRADSLLGEGQNAGVFDEVREAAKSIRILSDNLDKRTASLSGDITKFTGTGLRDLSGLIANGRETLAGVDRVVRELERNPQRFLFGGGGVSDYSPRR